MRKIFIDCGAHLGSSLKYFYENFADASEYHIYSFEANPNFHNHYYAGKHSLGIKNFNSKKFEYIPKAVWTENTVKTFYRRTKWHSESSTLSEEKYNIRTAKGQGFEKELVQCIDFPSWFKETISKEDYIILKMDIEGSEYEVLEKMYQLDLMGYINEFYCELHNIKCGKGREDDKRIIDQAAENGLTAYYWDANKDANCLFRESVYDYDYINDPNYPRF